MCFFFFFNDTATTEIYTLSLHDALPIYEVLPYILMERRAYGPDFVPTILAFSPFAYVRRRALRSVMKERVHIFCDRSEEHTSELQSQSNIVCRLLLVKQTQLPEPSPHTL